MPSAVKVCLKNRIKNENQACKKSQTEFIRFEHMSYCVLLAAASYCLILWHFMAFQYFTARRFCRWYASMAMSTWRLRLPEDTGVWLGLCFCVCSEFILTDLASLFCPTGFHFFVFRKWGAHEACFGVKKKNPTVFLGIFVSSVWIICFQTSSCDCAMIVYLMLADWFTTELVLNA